MAARSFSLATVLLALPLAAFAQVATPQHPPVPPELAGLDLWVKIIGGTLTALVTVIGIPAAFLQFSKTRAELKKLRLEAVKLSYELEGAKTDELRNHALKVDSPQAIVQVETEVGLSGPILVMIDFVVSYILYQAFRHLLSLSPFHFGFILDLAAAALRGVVFTILLLPVYLNGRQARLLLRDIAEARRKASGAASVTT